MKEIGGVEVLSSGGHARRILPRCCQKGGNWLIKWVGWFRKCGQMLTMDLEASGVSVSRVLLWLSCDSRILDPSEVGGEG